MGWDYRRHLQDPLPEGMPGVKAYSSRSSGSPKSTAAGTNLVEAVPRPGVQYRRPKRMLQERELESTDLQAAAGRQRSMRPVSRLRGMEDLSAAAWLHKRRVQDRLQELIAAHGYAPLETPILESTELFLRKSGGQLASRLYSFADPGGSSVSLRPEFTAPIMRHYLERAHGLELPVRRQYCGPVFRFEDDGATGGQFTQIGAELLGSGSVMADAELLLLAAAVPASMGISGCQFHLADLDLLNSILDTTGISERARTFVIEAVPDLGSGPGAIPVALEQADRLRLTAGGLDAGQPTYGVQDLDDDQARKVLHGMLEWRAADRLGQRDPGDVVDRMLRKVRGTDSEGNLRSALELASRLASVRGEPARALAQARSVIQDAGASTAALDRLEDFLELALAGPELQGCLQIDLGLIRGLAYYNGIVFEVRHPSQGASLGGGGRYDALAVALGSPRPVPALGFAYNLESLMELGAPGDDDAVAETPTVLLVGEDSDGGPALVEAARELRRQGLAVEMDVSRLTLEDALDRARNCGIGRVVAVSKDGRQITHQVS